MPEMMNLQREMNRLFSNMGQKSPQEYPAVNIWDKKGSAVITAELPGIDPEKLDISVSGDTVTISGAANQETLAANEIYLRQERGVGSFKRNIQLPFQIDAQAGGGALTQVNPQILQGVSQAMRVQTGGLGGAFVWPSLIRKLDRLDPAYRT